MACFIHVFLLFTEVFTIFWLVFICNSFMLLKDRYLLKHTELMCIFMSKILEKTIYIYLLYFYIPTTVWSFFTKLVNPFLCMCVMYICGQLCPVYTEVRGQLVGAGYLLPSSAFWQWGIKPNLLSYLSGLVIHFIVFILQMGKLWFEEIFVLTSQRQVISDILFMNLWTYWYSIFLFVLWCHIGVIWYLTFSTIWILHSWRLFYPIFSI